MTNEVLAKVAKRAERAQLLVYIKTSNNRFSEKRTTSIQWTNHLFPIDFTITQPIGLSSRNGPGAL